MQYRLKISIFTFFLIFIGLSSCKNKKICAAYNSYFVFDESLIAPMFAPFGADTTPGEKVLNRFNQIGLIKKNGARDDKALLTYKHKDFKEGVLKVDTAMVEDDSTGAIISVKELFPEKVNTDQEAYEHYMRQLNENFGKKAKPKQAGNTPSEVEEFDSLIYYNNPPEGLTKEEQKRWKKDKKAYKKRKKARDKARKAEAARKEEEESDEEEDFDFDFEEE